MGGGSGGTQDKQYGPRYKPKYPVEGNRQPGAWWDPKDGWWSQEPASGGSREHYDRWGNRIYMQPAAKADAVGAVTVGAGVTIWQILEGAALGAAAF